MNDLAHYAHESFKADYGEPHCPKCSNEAEEYDDEKHGEYAECMGCSNYACEHCETTFDSSDAYGDEPLGWTLDDGEYKAEQHGGDGDVFILRSPYYTHAQFCSPCAPGACHLRNPCEDGERAYCLSHDWFEDEIAPYPVYSVATNELIVSENLT